MAHLFVTSLFFFNWYLWFFIVFHRYCIFYRLKVRGNPVLSKSISTVFLTVFAHFMSLSHFGSSCNISNFFIICYGDVRSVIFEVTTMTGWRLRRWLAFLAIKHFHRCVLFSQTYCYCTINTTVNRTCRCTQFSSVAQLCLTLWPHESQHTSSPCPSPTPRVYSESCPSSQWCHPTISSSVVPFSSCPQSLPNQGFSNQSTLRMRWPKYWSFGFSISLSNEHLGLISFKMDWLDLLAVQGTLKSLLQHCSSEASILQCSAFFTLGNQKIHVTHFIAILALLWRSRTKPVIIYEVYVYPILLSSK